LDILRNLTYLAEALPCILCIIFCKKIITKDMKVFFFYSILLITCLSFLLFFTFVLHSDSLTYIVMRFFIYIEFVSLGLFYYNNIVIGFKKQILVFSSIAFFFYSFYDYFVSKSNKFSYYPLVIECFFFLIVIIYFFYEKMRYSVATPVYQSPSFWISVAFLIYFSGNFFQFLYSDPKYATPQFIDLLNIVYDIVTIIKDILLCIAVIVNNQQKKQVIMPNMPIGIDIKF
jgi:hypothetical protein